MKILMVSDTHFTDKPQDECRFDLFRQVSEIQRMQKANWLVVAGDVLDRKDNHSSKLLNRVVDGLSEWSKEFEEIVILFGNHDATDHTVPYFRFLNHFENISFIHSIDHNYEHQDSGLYFLPHTRNPKEEWEPKHWENKIVIAHMTVNGALAESMIPLESQIEPEWFNNTKLCFSGDVHKNQQVGPVIYIGSPFDTRFNPKSYDGSCILLDTETLKWERIPLDFPRRLVFDCESLDDLAPQILKSKSTIKRAQVKVRLHVTKNNLGQEQNIKRAITANFEVGQHYELCGFEIINELKHLETFTRPEERRFSDFDTYCIRHKVPENLVVLGKSIMEELYGPKWAQKEVAS